jgi:chromosome partitioning protein
VFNPWQKAQTMKVITLMNEKGGVGKTSLSVILAGGLALRGRRVVVIDADAQGNLTGAFGLERQPHFYQFCTVPAADLGRLTIARPVALAHYAPPGSTMTGTLYCIGSDTSTRRIAPLMHKEVPAERRVSRLVLRERLSALQRSTDVVIIDTPPTPSDLHEAIAAATDYVIMPTGCEVFSALEGLSSTLEHTENLRALAANSGVEVSQLLAIIPNAFKKASVVHQEILALIQQHYGAAVWEPVPETETIKQTHLRRRSLFALYPKHAVTRLMWSFVERVEAVL